MLRRLFTLLTLVSALALADNKQAVANAEKAWARAIATSDVKALDKLLDARLTYTHSNGVLDTKQSYISKIQAGTMRYLKAEHSKIDVIEVTADVAMTRAELTVETVSEGKPMKARLVVLHVYHKAGGVWQMVGHQSAKLAD